MFYKYPLFEKYDLCYIVYQAKGHELDDLGNVIFKPHLRKYLKKIPMFEELAKKMLIHVQKKLVFDIVAKATCRALGNNKIQNHYSDCVLFCDINESIVDLTPNTISFSEIFIEENEDWNIIRKNIVKYLSKQFNKEIIETHTSNQYNIIIKNWKETE